MIRVHEKMLELTTREESQQRFALKHLPVKFTQLLVMGLVANCNRSRPINLAILQPTHLAIFEFNFL